MSKAPEIVKLGETYNFPWILINDQGYYRVIVPEKEFGYPLGAWESAEALEAEIPGIIAHRYIQSKCNYCQHLCALEIIDQWECCADIDDEDACPVPIFDDCVEYRKIIDK